MSQNIIPQIKEQLNIVDLAERYGAEPVGNSNVVNTRINPLRDEKTSSLKLYRETNSWHDFGSATGGDVIDFYAIVNNITTADAIRQLKDELHIQGDVKDFNQFVSESEYMKPSVVKKVFEQQTPIDLKKHSKELYAIAPKWLFDNASESDKYHFFEIVRINVQDKTANASSMVLLKDEYGIERSIRYRRREINGELKKWVALQSTQSSVHYTRIKDGTPFTLIVEGTHDYLTAILSGYSVVAIPSAKFKLNSSIVENRLCVFIDDDDGKESMRKTFDEALCDKIWFNHSDFKKLIGKDTAKDFSDYIEQFESLHDFKNVFDDFILSSKPKEQSNYLDIIGNNGMTADFFDNIPEEFAIYDGFIYENQINMIYADGGVGKSILALAVCNHAIKENKCDSIVYIDNDNGVATLKNRVPVLIDKMGDKIHYYGKGLMESDRIVEIIDKLALLKKQKDRVLIVIDSLLFFVKGGVMTDTDVEPFMSKLQNIRDNFGATIILLHHVKKPQKEDKFPSFYGSVQIKNAVDISWAMIRNKNTITLKKDKGRPLSIHEMFNIEVDFRKLEINGVKILDDNEEDQERDNNSSNNDEDLLPLIKESLKKLGDISKTDFMDLGHWKGIASRREVDNILKNKTYKDIHFRFVPSHKDKNNVQRYFIKPIFDTQQSEPAIIEYKMENDMIIDMGGGALF